MHNVFNLPRLRIGGPAQDLVDPERRGEGIPDDDPDTDIEEEGANEQGNDEPIPEILPESNINPSDDGPPSND